MFFKKKSPKRLYYPTKSRWYSKPRKRKRSPNKRQRTLFGKAVKQGRVLFRRFAIAVIGGVLIIFLILFLGFSTYFSITDIKIARESFYVDSGAILQQLNHHIGRNLIFFPREEVTQVIQEHFPEFSEIRVDKSLPGTLTIYLQSHPVVANVRAYYTLPEADSFNPLSNTLESINEDQDSADSDTFAPIEVEGYVEGQDASGPIEQKGLLNQVGQVLFNQEESLEHITISIHDLTQPLEDRQLIVGQENMEVILTSIDYFNQHFLFQVSGLDYFPVSREIHLNTEKQMMIWLSLEKEIESQLDKLILIYDQAGLDEEDISYVDLRVNEKVIYCPREAECDAP